MVRCARDAGLHTPFHAWNRTPFLTIANDDRAEGIAVVNFSKDEGDIQASGPYASVELDLAKEIRIWRGQRRMPVKLAGRVVEELFVRYYSPTETDAEYIAGHNLTSYQLGDTPFFLLLIVRPRGNNAGASPCPQPLALALGGPQMLVPSLRPCAERVVPKLEAVC